jgi:hypothetical protein
MKRASAWPWAAAGLVAGVVVGPGAPAWAQDSKVLAGYWEGKGTIWDRPLDDAVRKLTRRSETTFWFACHKQLRCRGEATTTYAADLQAVKWSIPLPTGAIEAAVAGSSEKTTLTYPIEGTIADRKLQLRVVGEAADLVVPNAAFEFVLTATATLPATGAVPARAPSMQIIKIPAKAWSPFQQLEAPITKRPQGPYVASVKKAGEKFSIEWHAQRTPARPRRARQRGHRHHRATLARAAPGGAEGRDQGRGETRAGDRGPRAARDRAEGQARGALARAAGVAARVTRRPRQHPAWRDDPGRRWLAAAGPARPGADPGRGDSDGERHHRPRCGPEPGPGRRRAVRRHLLSLARHRPGRDRYPVLLANRAGAQGRRDGRRWGRERGENHVRLAGRGDGVLSRDRGDRCRQRRPGGVEGQQPACPGVRPQLPSGLRLDPDGRLRATIRKRAVGQDEMGVHIESRRNDMVVEEEWWKVTDAGLVVTRLKSGGEDQTFDPPGPIWPWPLKAPRRWYHELGPSLKQTFRMWSPVPVKAPAGQVPGFVVLMQQPSQPIALSVERHYAPGIGMVRQVVVQARNGAMLTRWESVLTAAP